MNIHPLGSFCRIHVRLTSSALAKIAANNAEEIRKRIVDHPFQQDGYAAGGPRVHGSVKKFNDSTRGTTAALLGARQARPDFFTEPHMFSNHRVFSRLSTIAQLLCGYWATIQLRMSRLLPI